MQIFFRAAALAAFLFCAALRVQGATTFSSDASDLWWNPNESGWGINIEQQGNVIFATLFVYGTDGRAHWYVAPDTEASFTAAPIMFSGALYETTGPAFSASFNPNMVGTRQVGTLTFGYTPPASAQLTYSVDGVTVNKSVVRQTWRNVNLHGEYHIWRSVRGTNSSSCSIGSMSEDMIVSQSGSSVTIQLIEGGTTTRCFMSGAIQQNGRMATISGTANCQGSTGPFVFDDMEVGVHGFTARYEGQDLNGCTLVAHVAGAVDTPP
jgi:hypothetical protein